VLPAALHSDVNLDGKLLKCEGVQTPLDLANIVFYTVAFFVQGIDPAISPLSLSREDPKRRDPCGG
jgi:hypothetical protein